jgi:threonyl-tRNA synthetase
MENNQVAVRQRGQGDLGAMPIDEFIGKIKQDIAKRI